MKRYLLLLITILSLVLGTHAQNQMHVVMKDGSAVNLFVTEIDHVEWDYYSDESDVNNPDDPTVTGEAIDVTENSATIVGYANNVRDNESTDVKIGIIYCTNGTPNKSNGTQKNVSQIGNDGKYTISLTGLSRGTTYYYRSFVYQSGLWFYGKVRSFTTIANEITANFYTGAASDITCFSAKVSAKMNLTTTLSYNTMYYGIFYGTSPEPTKQIIARTKDEAGNYTVQLRALEGNTIYYYRPYVYIDGSTYYGQTSSFKTIPDNVVETGEIDADGNVRSRLTIAGGAYSTLEVGLCWIKGDALPTIKDYTATTNELDDENYYVIKPDLWIGSYCYRAYVKIDDIVHYGAMKTHEESMMVGQAVDLGLSVKWADINIGAKKPEYLGARFAWGEIKPKDKYDDSNYSQKNNYLYGITSLKPDDDAAHINWGGDWRMPTTDELSELLTQCSQIETIQNGVKGTKFTSKINGNSIFLPYYKPLNSSTAPSLKYWSCQRPSSSTYDAYALTGTPFNHVTWQAMLRCSGYPIRPVCQ